MIYLVDISYLSWEEFLENLIKTEEFYDIYNQSDIDGPFKENFKLLQKEEAINEGSISWRIVETFKSMKRIHKEYDLNVGEIVIPLLF